MKQYIGAIDQGTTSTRFIIFDKQGAIISTGQREHNQICKKPGWVEHDPVQIWDNIQIVIKEALDKANISANALAGIGVTNQRETIAAWDKHTGKPLHNAIVWQCSRSQGICNDLIKNGGQDRFKKITGLPVATYFSGPKIKWLMDEIPEIKKGIARGSVLFGTMDTWIIWNLTGGPNGGRYITDVTNASRTLLMNLETLDWDSNILLEMGIDQNCLPAIVPSSDANAYGSSTGDGPFGAVIPIGGAMGDQQAALFGQACFETGEAKNTYGTGCFLLFNTGNEIQFSSHGLLTTLGFQIGNEKPVYVLEGSIAYAGALVQWIRDNLGLIKRASQIETLAKTVEDNGDVYCVPAFSGLYAPHWRSDARGIIAGLTQFATKGHIARAVIESTAYQTKDIVDAIQKDLSASFKLKHLKVDGGMVANTLLMQFQSDILNKKVIRPEILETTALGAAYVAGLAVGYWSNKDDLKKNWAIHTTYESQQDEVWRTHHFKGWQKAVQRTFNWA